MTPPDLGSVLGPSDYPVWALQDNESAAAILDLLIEPNGKISRCQSGAIYGSKRLASEICDLVKGNRVGPARDPTGNNIHGVAHTLLRLWLPDTNNGREIERLQQASDVVLSVNRLPGEAKRAEVDVAVMVDEEGKVLACEPAGPKVDALLARTVCTASDQLGVRSVNGMDGQPVRYVTKLKVELTTRSLSPQPDSSAEHPR